MRDIILKRLVLGIFFACTHFFISAQTITIDNANFSAGPYGNGGSISVPIDIVGCFNRNNNFQLELSDPSGNFPGNIIGTYNGFFTPYVNGVIPAGTLPGVNYRVRVLSTDPAGVIATSNIFSILATPSNVVPNPTTSPTNTINDTTFGRCLMISNTNLNLGVVVPFGTTMLARVLDSLGNIVPATIGANTIAFSMVVGNYYTVQITIRNADNSISVRSFLVLASTSNLSLQTAGANEICLPDTKEYTINTTASGGIRNNYPGTIYTVDWGDGVTTTYTHCELIQRNGSISHEYTQTSCGRPAITDIVPNQYNAFRVNVTASNDFCSNSFTPISSFAKVWERPEANFVNPEYGCLNTPITFNNTSEVGLSGSNNAQNCTSSTQYEWYVDGIFVSSATNLVHSFSTPGNHTVQLVALNDPCSDDTTMVICIEEVPIPDFTMNGLNSISGCAPLVVNINNLTNLVGICRPYTWNWQIIRVPGGTATEGVHYTITPNAADPNPVITFLVPGDYVIRLTISNSCGTFVRERNVTLALDADVNLPPTQQYCGLQTLNFGLNPLHLVSYNVNSGSLTYNWNITPATISYVGGTTATSAYPQVQFNAYGTYTVQVTFTNDCGTDQATQQIIFYQPVTANAGTDQTVCYTVPSVNLNGTSSGPAGYTSAWSIQTGSGTISNANIPNPTYTFSPGDITAGSVRLIYTATPLNPSACSVVRDTVLINITPNTIITSANTTTICSGTTFNHTITSSVPGTTYSWTSSVISGTATGNTPAGNTNLISDILTNTSSTDNATVRYVITPTVNGCVGTPQNFDLIVKATPAFTTAPSSTTICNGESLTINLNSAFGGAAYTWNAVVSGGSVSGVTNQATPLQTTSIVNTLTNTGTTDATVTYTITVYNPNVPVCTGNTEQVVITVRPAINATASSNGPVCVGQTINLTGSSTSAGATYSWVGPNGFTSNIQNPTINNAILLHAGVYTLEVTSGGCTASSNTVVVVNTSATLGGATGSNPTSCATPTGFITLDGLSNSTTYTISYTFNGNPPTSVSLTSDGTGNIIIPNLVAGIYNNITASFNGCPSNPVGPVTLSDPSAPNAPTAGSNGPICSGNTLLLNASTTSPGLATYTWSGPNGFSSTDQNPTIINASVLATGTYNVTVSINNCTSSTGTLNVVINQTPVIPVASSNTPICSGSTLNLTSSTATAGVITYAWTGPNAFASSDQNPSITNATIAAAGTYSVTATLGNCTSAAGTTNVVVNPTPVISGSSANNPTNCSSSTGSISLNGLVASTTYSVNYTQGATPQTASIVTDATGILSIANLPAGTYSNISVTLNNCPSNIVGPFNLVDPTPPATPALTSNGPICSGNTLNLTASTTSPGVASWAWSGPNGFASTDQNPSITNATVLASGTYTVLVTINSCTSNAATMNVVVNQTPATPVVNSNTPVCTDSTLNLSASTTTGGILTWAWTGPNGFNSIVQNPTIPNIGLAGAGIYSVIATATTGNCPSAAANTVVVVNQTPFITTTSFTNPTDCATPTGTITLNGLTASTSYTVRYTFAGNPQTTTISSDATGSLTITNLLAGTYTNISVSQLSCASNIMGPITLADPNPPATPGATSNGPVCSGNILQLNAVTSTPGAVTYTWTGPNNFTSTSQNPTIASATLAANGTYNVTATLNSCVSPAGSVNVVINETPSTPVASNNGPICADSTLNLTASTTFAGAVSWLWNGPNTFTSSSQNPSIASASTAANGTYNVIATATTGNCPSAAGVTNVVINPTPVISSASFTNPILCLSSTGTIVLNGLAPSTAFTVTYTRNTAPVTTTITSEGTGSLIIPLLSAGTYADVRITTLVGCPSNTVGPFVLVDPNPPAAPTAGSNSPICTGETLTLNANTVTPGAITYTWSGPAAFSSNVQNPSIINATPANSGTYTVTATLNNCVSPPTSVLVEVTALPSPPTVTSPVNYCIDAPAVPLTATTVPGNTLRWYTSAVGGTGTATAPTPTTNATGVTTYYVSQVTALGCEGSRAAIDVIVNPDALAEFVASPLIECAPFNIDATIIQPTVYPTRNNVYNWYANDVLIGTGTTFPGYTIIQPGDSILIKLVTTSLFGCKSDSTSTRFYTFPVPVTDFTASDTVGCGPLSVTFTNTTPNPGSFNFNWNFGNGVTSSAVNPGTIIFQPNPTAGDTIYNVSLAAYTQCDTIIKVVPIRVKSRPRAIITPDKTYGCSPLTVVFNNISLGVNMTFEWNFGDGSPSFFTNNTSPVSHTYNTAQQDTFYVRLIATNDCGSDTGFYNIVVAARTINLDVAINGNQTTGCAPHAVRFFNNSTGATNFVWDFGDGNLRSTTNNIDTIDHSYLTTGTFSVVIRASNGCTDTSITETISVFAKPLVNFSALPSPVCVGDTVFFNNQTDTATGFLWNFGDGITSQLTNPVHAYQTPGTYDVKLIGIRQYAPGNACTDSIIKQITVVATLPGSFAVSDSIGDCIPFNVTFTSQTFPSALTTWNFGNGAVDTGNVVNYTFTNPGTFIVTMTVRDPDGCTYVATRNIIVNGPTGSFTYDNGFICGNTPVRFEANTTGTDSIRWNFGDGTFLTATSNVVYHTYSQSGVYVPSAELISGTNGNCRRTIIGGDTIRVDYVNAGFTSTQLRLCGSTTVNFNDTSRSYFPMQTWQWNFGDGNSSSVRHPNHTYTSTNTWPIQLIATSSSGCADTTIAPVFVKVDVKPEASIVHDPVGCVNQPVTYNSVVISPDPITYYSWTFSNLASGNTATLTNNYAAPGNYTAQLITGTSFGCYDTVTSTITINPSPFVNTSPNMVICRGESAQINTTGGLTYTWAPFTGLSCNNCPNPIASPLTTTQYVVSGFNSFGCAARDTILITVPQPIDVTATANTVMCIGDTVQLNATGAASYVWSPANTLNNANIPNPIATPPATTVYRVIGFDGYNCFEDTAYITVGVGNYPVVNVGIDRLIATGELINLAPTVTNGPIAIWNWTPPTDLSCATCPSPIATAKKEICYTVTATNFFGCSGSDTMCIRVFCESSQVFIPNAFTPDADGINDVLVVKSQGVKAVKSFRIFNRWGQMVFEKSNFPPNIESFGWDGKVKGVAAPPDVYVYTCEVLCENDVPYTYKGNTAILK